VLETEVRYMWNDCTLSHTSKTKLCCTSQIFRLVVATLIKHRISYFCIWRTANSTGDGMLAPQWLIRPPAIHCSDPRVTPQKNWVFSYTAVRTSNLTKLCFISLVQEAIYIYVTAWWIYTSHSTSAILYLASYRRVLMW